MDSLQEHWLPFAVALGAGLLVGVERERRKGSGRHRAVAGVRTFTIASLAGALAQWLGQPLLVAIGAALVLTLIAIGYFRERGTDRGITTELALFITYLLGVAAVEEPLAAGAGGVVLAALLAARTDLHRFSTEILTEGELRDVLILAGAVLVVLPLVPNVPVGWLAGLNPRRLWTLVVIMLALQAAGHVALRVAGPRLGLPLSGLAMGFVSSTATFAAMGAKSYGRPELAGAAVSGALASNVATLIQLTVVVATVHAPALEFVAAPLAGGAIGAVAGALLSLRGSRRAPASEPVSARALRLTPALVFASLMSLLMAGGSYVHTHFGDRVAIAAIVVAAAADVHAAAASLTALIAGGRIAPEHLALPLMLAFLVNTIGKWIAARVGGGWQFARSVLPGLALTIAGLAAPAVLGAVFR